MAAPESADGPDNAGVRVPPPLIFLTLLLLGLWYDSPWFDGHMATMELTIGGGILATLGFALLIPCALGFKKAGSHLEPWKPTTAIISTGVYGYSRNPIYLGMAMMHGGLAIGGGSMAALGTLVIGMMIIQIYVIAREERYLEAKFGAEYNDYRTRVRRWV